jgi:hypothetical protein
LTAILCILQGVEAGEKEGVGLAGEGWEAAAMVVVGWKKGGKR